MSSDHGRWLDVERRHKSDHSMLKGEVRPDSASMNAQQPATENMTVQQDLVRREPCPADLQRRRDSVHRIGRADAVRDRRAWPPKGAGGTASGSAGPGRGPPPHGFFFDAKINTKSFEGLAGEWTSIKKKPSPIGLSFAVHQPTSGDSHIIESTL
jgi:hypothetical protein